MSIYVSVVFRLWLKIFGLALNLLYINTTFWGNLLYCWSEIYWRMWYSCICYIQKWDSVNGEYLLKNGRGWHLFYFWTTVPPPPGLINGDIGLSLKPFLTCLVYSPPIGASTNLRLLSRTNRFHFLLEMTLAMTQHFVMTSHPLWRHSRLRRIHLLLVNLRL